VQGRVLLGVGAWLLGAATATGGSLLAVSVLGQGMTPAAGQQLSVAAVNRALASEAHDPAAASAASPLPRPSTVAPPRVARRRVPRHSPSSPSGTVLTSEGGTVVAGCAGAQVYLMSWSPQQGFEAATVLRGPAVTARATFTGRRLTVTMVVSCPAGVPTARSTATGTWGGDE
jgi:hypothetical protein